MAHKKANIFNRFFVDLSSIHSNGPSCVFSLRSEHIGCKAPEGVLSPLSVRRAWAPRLVGRGYLPDFFFQISPKWSETCGEKIVKKNIYKGILNFSKSNVTLRKCSRSNGWYVRLVLDKGYIHAHLFDPRCNSLCIRPPRHSP